MKREKLQALNRNLQDVNIPEKMVKPLTCGTGKVCVLGSQISLMTSLSMRLKIPEQIVTGAEKATQKQAADTKIISMKIRANLHTVA
ncbi:Hypothetical protein PBPRB0284 [Photobacterium profundum SS9]|uniref:Uncharacterized protein n=1 Tax=Photobacterium profundum (strain SS9) TaxID=298386 RepID=Q6LL57_PHOPR|nr:Hypothetical protein PBPRB0284 [Photobacterium profundum SS9]